MKPYDATNEAIKEDPYEHYRELQRHCPVHHQIVDSIELGRMNDNPMVARPTAEYFQVFRYEDCVRILQDHGLYSSRQGPGPERLHAPNEVGMLIYADPPYHGLHRRIVNKALSARRVSAMEIRIRAIADSLVDDFVHDGRVDIATAFADTLPGLVFAEILGVRPDDQPMFKRWADDIVSAFAADEATRLRSVTSMFELAGYFLDLIHRRRTLLESGVELPDDLLTALMTSDYEGRTFNDEELILVLQILIAGGNETTASALSNAVKLLCDHPDQLQLVRNDYSMIPVACEEVLRFETLPNCLFRTTTGEAELAGTAIPPDAKVGIMFGAANRDASVFTDPDRFDITRDIRELRQHLSFGKGIHACAGTALARAQMRIGLETLFDRLPNFRLESGAESKRIFHMIVRRYTSLWIEWDKS